MTVHKTQLVSRLANLVVLSTLLGSVLLVLPFFEGFIFSTKLFVFFILTLILGGLFVWHTIQQKTIAIVLAPITVPLLLFGLSIAAATFFTNSYPVESLLGLGGVLLAVVVFVFFSGSLVTEDLAKKVLPVAGISGAILTVLSVAQQLGYGPAHFFNQVAGTLLPTSLAFNLTGSAIYGLQFLVLVAFGMIVESVARKHISQSTAILLPILLIGIALHAWAILPGKPGAFTAPPVAASWSIALDTIRAPRTALIGAGPASYSNMYNRFKPLWVNGTPEWSLSYTQATSLPLTLLTTTGFLGLASWLFVAGTALRMRSKIQQNNRALLYVLLASIVVQLFMPTNIVLFIFQAVLIVALIASQRGKLPVLRFQALTMSMDGPQNSFQIPTQKVSFPIYFTAGVLAIVLGIAGMFLVRSVQASTAFYQASAAANSNDIIGLYEKQQAATTYNPYLDVYRRQYAVTNLLIATSLSNKTDITEAEKAQVSELIQQATREARAAVLLDPLDVENTAILAQIYQNMIGVAEEADQFAVQAYLQAIENAPTDPTLRLSLGSLFIQQEQYEQAASIFRQTVDIKPDFPNTYYNLAFTLKQIGALADAKLSYETLLKLLDPSSEDYATVLTELEEVTRQLEQQAAENPDPDVASEGITPPPNTTTPSLINQSLEEPPTQTLDTPSDASLTTPPTTGLGEQLQ